MRVHRIMQSQEQTLDPVNEKEKDEDNPKGESPLKIKVEATQVQAAKVEETKGELPPKTCVKSYLKAIIEELEKKPKKKATKKITKEETKINALQVQGHTSCWTKR